MDSIKLNLGAGDIKIPGYVAIDRKMGAEVYPLNYPDNSVDIIRASHILEHFGHQQTLKVLGDWVNKLKVGGKLRIAVPDFKKISSAYLSGKKVNTLGYLMGGQIDADDFHRAIFDEESLTALMKAAGLDKIKSWKSKIKDAAALPISLNLEGTKVKNTTMKNYQPKVAAVMSMPRLSYTSNFHTAMKILSSLSIPLERGGGVYWVQILSRMLEKQISNNIDFILTIDFDSWFTAEQVVRLCQLMVQNPGVDAIVPVQTKRGSADPLFSLKRKATKNSKTITVPLEVFKKPLTEIATGHFGLTLLRVSMLKKLKKPWLWAQPAPDGSWNEGHVDADIYFWNQFNKQDFKACLANEIFIGHTQEICTFAGRPEDNFRPVHVFMNDLETKGPPEHCLLKPRREIKL